MSKMKELFEDMIDKEDLDNLSEEDLKMLNDIFERAGY